MAKRSRGVTKPRAGEREREAVDIHSWGTAQDYQAAGPAAEQETITTPPREAPLQEGGRGEAEGETPHLREVYEGQPEGRVLSPLPEGTRVTSEDGTAPTTGAANATGRESSESGEGPGGGIQGPGRGASEWKAQDLSWGCRSACNSEDSQEQIGGAGRGQTTNDPIWDPEEERGGN